VTWTPRPIAPDEMPAVVDLLALGFGFGPAATPAQRAEVMAVAEPERILVVEDEGRIVATAAAYGLHVALPGGTAPMAGVSEVVVSPTHRRRGLLTTLIEAVHDQAVERGEPLAGLTASEGGIYRRFGYGVATRYQAVRLDAARSAEIAPLVGAPGEAAAGRMRFVDEGEAATILPVVWDRHWRRTPGEVDRTPGFWVADALDHEHTRAGASARHIVVHDDDLGRPDGFVTYRIAQDLGAGGAGNEARVLALAAASEPVAATLLRFVLDIDLVGTVTWNAPVDAPLRWRLVDPRALTVHAERDLLWLRPLDVPACLAARRYATDGELVVRVVDDRRDGGTFRLVGGPDGATCAPTDRSAELVVTTSELGAALAGGTTWRTLHRAGRVAENRPGAVDRADALFRPDQAAYCATEF
jgi:predicted acetyltransferase